MPLTRMATREEPPGIRAESRSEIIKCDHGFFGPNRKCERDRCARGHAQAAQVPRDIDYVLEVSPDLASWNSGGAVAQEINASDDGNGITETVRLRVLSDVTQPGGRFVRLRVSRQ